AEDGIRDLIVTGVQTCALPISPGGVVGRALRRPAGDRRARVEPAAEARGGPPASPPAPDRSRRRLQARRRLRLRQSEGTLAQQAVALDRRMVAVVRPLLPHPVR